MHTTARILSIQTLSCLLAAKIFLGSPIMAADSKAIKAQQRAGLRDFMETIFTLEQDLNHQVSGVNMSSFLGRMHESLGKIAPLLDPKTQKHLTSCIESIGQAKTPKPIEAALSVLKHETIRAFEIDTAPSLSPKLELGSARYAEFCSSCHGKSGDGKGILTGRLPKTPRAFTSAKLAHKISPLRSLNILLHGSKQTGMPAFADQLSIQDLWNTSFYLQSLAHPYNNRLSRLEPQLISKGLSYSRLAELNDDELWEWLRKNLSQSGERIAGRPELIAYIRTSYSFSKRVPRY